MTAYLHVLSLVTKFDKVVYFGFFLTRIKKNKIEAHSRACAARFYGMWMRFALLMQ